MIGLELTDGKGRTWNLQGTGSWPRAGAGVRGLLGRPNIMPHRSLPSAATHGTRWRGWRAADRTPIIPLEFEDAADLVGQVREFVAGIVPEQPGQQGNAGCVMTAILPDATRWQLGMQLVGDGDITVDSDPDEDGTLNITTSWDADVFWAGPVWSSTWQAAAAPSGSWLLGPGGGGVARLSAGHTLSTASATNAGDVRVWPVWTVVGPCTWLSVGVGDLQVSGSVTLGAGESLTIDTDPEDGQMAVHSSGADWTDRLDAVGFAPLEPGSNPLNVTMTGTGTVSMSFRPLRLALL